MKSLKLILLILFAFILGAGAGFGGWQWLFIHQPNLACGTSCQNAVTPDHRFFSEELLLLGKTDDGSPFLLRLDLNRKKIADAYSHYYYGDFLYKNQRRQLYTAFKDSSGEVQARDFLAAYSPRMHEDLSARESLALNFDYKDIHVKADIGNFNGDFLVKNTLDYTKYVSEGEGDVVVNGKTYRMHALLSRIYTPYYDKYVFFDGYDELDSLAQFFILWDERGNLYVLDHSEVQSNLPNYRSHTWVLYKDRAGQYMKKAFSAQVQAEQTNFIPRRWSMYIPDLEANLELTPAVFITGKRDNGLAQGTVTTPAGSLPITGFFQFSKYGGN